MHHEPADWQGWELTITSERFELGNGTVTIDADGGVVLRRDNQLERCAGVLTEHERYELLTWIDRHDLMGRDGLQTAPPLHSDTLNVRLHDPGGTRAELFWAQRAPAEAELREILAGLEERLAPRCRPLRPADGYLHVHGSSFRLSFRPGEVAAGARAERFPYSSPELPECPGAIADAEDRAGLLAQIIDAIPPPPLERLRESPADRGPYAYFSLGLDEEARAGLIVYREARSVFRVRTESELGRELVERAASCPELEP